MTAGIVEVAQLARRHPRHLEERAGSGEVEG